MARDATGRDAPTRRDYLTYGGAVLGGGLLAGCTGTGADETTTSSDSTSGGSTSTEATADASYTVSMAPMGEVTFEAVPQNVLAGSTNYLDAMAALGHGSAATSTSSPSTTTPSLEYYYTTLDVSTDWLDLEKAGEYGKETLYELDSDVHFVDPAYLTTLDGWSQSDLREVEENVGPFFGNMYSRKHRQPPEAYRDSYQYYTLWEMASKYAAVFRERERFERLHGLKQGLMRDVEAELPPQDERPTVGMVYPRLSENAFYVHKLNQPGYFFAHTRPLGANDVFADIETGEYGGKLVDYEAMLEADPDVIIMNHGISSYYDVPEAKESIRSHSVGSQLTAVENDRLYASGNPRQGPVMNLFQLEMTAKQFYPELFGEWPGFSADQYPEIPESERLFDRQRLADVINGAV
ncbi:ABC transporter substrate-binding protein (plasmid) [Halarchaeum sp. CBA1220]|uniref:ABC transporter substrate-binding protein n=1 Tax=Halarchaeum sp. CBA1220 TaxID=1853682 RepID=UPI000F3AA189|nr:ABC transporter substrate-binding protein [Halarchaeum sp. CBA1220]QLC35322.1 ABC transporter substrate-binding protein [Halarchaeum sp. CBA1220]